MNFKIIVLTAMGFTGVIGACSDIAPVETTPAAIEVPAIVVSPADFAPLIGEDWEGALTYLNYGSDKRSTIPVRLIVKAAENNAVPYAIKYPGEEDANADGRFRISADGGRIDNQRVISRRDLPDGGTEIITEDRGQDDNQAADIQTIYTISDRLFKMRKMVRFDGTDDWIERNEYILKR